MSKLWLVAGFVELIQIHGPAGQKVFVNIHEITSLREPIPSDRLSYFAPGVHCIVVTTNGKFIAARETCDQIHALISWPKQKD